VKPSNLIPLIILFYFLCVDKTCAQQRFLLSFHSELAVNEKYNFYPAELMGFMGIGAYIPLIRSGKDLSLGADAQIKFGQNLILDNVLCTSIPVYLALRYHLDDDKRWGFGGSAGAGLEHYSRNYSFENRKQIDLRPTIYLEVLYLFFGRPIFLRYNYFFTANHARKSGLQIGTYLEF